MCDLFFCPTTLDMFLALARIAEQLEENCVGHEGQETCCCSDNDGGVHAPVANRYDAARARHDADPRTRALAALEQRRPKTSKRRQDRAAHNDERCADQSGEEEDSVHRFAVKTSMRWAAAAGRSLTVPTEPVS